VHITQMLALRPVPAAGVFLTLTRRCPLSCAHCSTNSMLTSEEHAATIFADFARTFTRRDHPDVVWLTGGEPLLRPDLVHEIVSLAHAAGAQVALITGLYFARRDGRIPPRLLRALLAVDHVVASQDLFHEVQVPREAAFATIAALTRAGQDVSFQVVGTGATDPYLAEITAQIRHAFDDRVPALVAPLGSAGRAKEFLKVAPVHRDQQPIALPCTVAAWPVVTFDGSIVACCQQQVVDGPAPSHLRLGTAPADGWPAIARAVRERATLRALRTFGPEVIAHEAGARLCPQGYCGTCASLDGNPQAVVTVEMLTSRPTFALVEAEVQRISEEAGPESFARRFGIAEYAHMLTLGLRPEQADTARERTADAALAG
jgi:pyruvate-formate lyase-activating enzyme